MARRRLKTSTSQEVRTSLTKVINMVYNGELDPKAANTIILGCNSILSTIKVDEFEKQCRDDMDVADEWKKAIIKVFEKRKEKENAEKKNVL